MAVAPKLIASPFAHVAATVGKGKDSVIGVAGERMKLSFWRADAKLLHTFTVAGSSRTSTNIVLTRIEYGGEVGFMKNNSAICLC